VYKSASAFAPICNPVNCPWGEKAFTGYLGEDKSLWAAHDATELVKSYDGPDLHLLIDQGDADNFYTQKQLLPENFKAACDEKGVSLTLNLQPGYDHSYYFIATFIEAHIAHHAAFLKA
jgi:S-formylglutathione hydrolase